MKVLIAALFVAAFSATAFAAGSVQCSEDSSLEVLFAQTQQTVTADKAAEKSVAQEQTATAKAETVAAEQRGRGPERGHGRHHREGRRERRWGRYLCDEVAYNVNSYQCSSIAGQEGWPVYVLDGYVCLGCE